MMFPLVFLCADGNLFLKALINALLCLAYLTLHKGGVHEGSVFQVPVPAHCIATRAAKGWELMLPLATILNWMSCEFVYSR